MKGDSDLDLAAVAYTLRTAGARLALLHGSRATTIPGTCVSNPGSRVSEAGPEPAPRPGSDLDVGAWWCRPRPRRMGGDASR